MTDNQAFIIGTCKLNLIDSTNKVYINKALAAMKDMPRGSWLLIGAYNKVENYNELYKVHYNKQKKVRKANRVPFNIPTENVAANTGYILFKDNKIVIFYTNDLKSSPSKPIMYSHEQEALDAVRGVAPI